MNDPTKERESHQEMLERVEAMARDKGETWDLSENDQAALRYVVVLLAEGCDERCTKCNAPNSGVRGVCGTCGAELPGAVLTRLTTRTEEMERALRAIAEKAQAIGCYGRDRDFHETHWCNCTSTNAIERIAREALKEGEEKP